MHDVIEQQTEFAFQSETQVGISRKNCSREASFVPTLSTNSNQLKSLSARIAESEE